MLNFSDVKTLLTPVANEIIQILQTNDSLLAFRCSYLAQISFYRVSNPEQPNSMTESNNGAMLVMKQYNTVSQKLQIYWTRGLSRHFINNVKKMGKLYNDINRTNLDQVGFDDRYPNYLRS